MDNMDGAAASVAASSAVVLGLWAAAEGDPRSGAVAFAVAAACAAFLRFNLARAVADLPRRRRKHAARFRARGGDHVAARRRRAGAGALIPGRGRSSSAFRLLTPPW